MRVRRGDLHDVLVSDGRAAVFVRGQVLVLSEMATVILEATPFEGSTGLTHLKAVVEAEFGPPESPHDSLELTRVQVAALVAHHVLLDVSLGPDA